MQTNHMSLSKITFRVSFVSETYVGVLLGIGL